MQDYCGEVKQEETLRIGLDWLSSARESEITMAYARNPHELSRTIEALSHVNVSEAIIHACLARRASSPRLGMNRLDYPDVDPPEWNKFLTIRQQSGEIKTGELPFEYWLRPPYSGVYEENYRRCSHL